MEYTIEELQEKARELADMVGNEIVDGYLPLELLEMTADALKEDYRQIVRAAEDIREEEKAIEKLRYYIHQVILLDTFVFGSKNEVTYLQAT